MAPPLLNLLNYVTSKSAQVEEIHKALLKKTADLTAENENLKAELEETRKTLDNVRIDNEFLTMSHRLADSPDAIISTRRRIARLIRTIDNCISMIKED